MRLVCATEEWTRKYQELCECRQLGYLPWMSRQGLFVAEGKDLVAGCLVYDTTGPFLFFEHLVTNETAPLRLRWQAVDLMASEVVSMCRHVGKLPQVLVRHKGIKKILERYGLQSTRAVSMSCAVTDLETHDQAYPFASQSRYRRQDSTATEPAPPGHPEDCSGIYAEVLGGATG